jgi:hypothetical protein
MYIHPSIHTSIHPSIHTYIHTYIHTFLHSYIHEHVDVGVGKCERAHNFREREGGREREREKGRERARELTISRPPSRLFLTLFLLSSSSRVHYSQCDRGFFYFFS